MPNRPKLIPMSKPASPTNSSAVAGHGVLRNQIIVSIGPTKDPKQSMKSNGSALFGDRRLS